MLALQVLGLLFAIIIGCVIFKPRNLFYLYAGTLPLFGVIAEVGVQVTPTLLVSVGMMISLLLTGVGFVKIPGVILAYMAYAIAITIAISFNLPDEVMDYPALRGRLRWVSQIFVLILLFMPILFICTKAPRENEIQKMINSFLVVVGILCVLGIVQLMVYRTTGRDLFPIDLFNPSERSELRSGLTALGGLDASLRMSSLGAGEPKHFGYTCVIALTLLALKSIFFSYARFPKWLTLGGMGLFVIGIFFSFSTQAYLILAINGALIFLLLLFKFGVFNKVFILYSIVLISLSVVIIQNKFVNMVFQARVLERIEETGVVEDFNVTIITFLKDKPQYLVLGTGLGQVHFFAQEYIPKQFKYYMRNSVFVAKAGLLRIISETGLIGLIFFLSIIMYLFFKLNQFRKLGPKYFISISLFFLVIVYLDYWISSDSSPYYIFSFVLCFAALQNARRVAVNI